MCGVDIFVSLLPGQATSTYDGKRGYFVMKILILVCLMVGLHSAFASNDVSKAQGDSLIYKLSIFTGHVEGGTLADVKQAVKLALKQKSSKVICVDAEEGQPDDEGAATIKATCSFKVSHAEISLGLDSRELSEAEIVAVDYRKCDAADHDCGLQHSRSKNGIEHSSAQAH